MKDEQQELRIRELEARASRLEEALMALCIELANWGDVCEGSTDPCEAILKRPLDPEES